MACWFSPDAAALGETLMALSLSTNGNTRYAMLLSATGALQVGKVSGGTSSFATGAVTTNGRLHHGLVYFENSTSRGVSLDGQTFVTASASVGSITPNRTCLGFRRNSSDTGFYDGALSEACFWAFPSGLPADLQEACTAFAAGRRHSSYRPDAIVGYYKADTAASPLVPIIGSTSLSQVATPTTDETLHGRLILPAPRWLRAFVGGGPVSVTPAAASLALSAIAPTVIRGSISLQAAAAILTLQAMDPTVAIGDLSVSPAAATLNLQAIAPSVVLGSVIITPAAASLALNAQAPVVQIGGLLVSPAEAQLLLEALGPTVTLGSVSVSPATAILMLTAGNPIVLDDDVAARVIQTLNLKLGLHLCRM